MGNWLQINGVALITGAASGLGRDIAVAFACEGARAVALCDINLSGLAETEALVREAAICEGFQSLILETNVAAQADCARAIEETVRNFQRIDVGPFVISRGAMC